MKRYLFLIVLFVAVPLAAYKVGPAGRANFGSADQQPAATQPEGFRPFTNANNQWRQGVQTQTVQTSRAGSETTEFEPADKKKQNISKKAAVAPVPEANKPAVPASTQPSSGTVNMPANADPAAMLQQVQGMMQGMQGMMGGAANGQPAAAGQNAMPTMPAGMPDLSSLMGGMMPGGAAPAAVPSKK